MATTFLNKVLEIFLNPVSEKLTTVSKYVSTTIGLGNSGSYSITCYSDTQPCTFDAILAYIRNNQSLLSDMRTLTIGDKDQLEPGYKENTFPYQDPCDMTVSYKMEISRTRLDSGDIPKEQLQLKIITPDDINSYPKHSEVLRTFIEKIIKDYNLELTTKIQIWMITRQTNWHQLNNLQNFRDFSSIVLKDGQKEIIKTALDEFINDRIKKCIFLFHGQPGSGKTTLARCIATYLKQHSISQHNSGNIYNINLSYAGMTSDHLIRLIDSVPKNNVILIEDIDTIMDPQFRPNIISEASLTNILDGITNIMDGKVTIITTNNIERLPGRLIRPGRITVNMEIGTPTDKQIYEYIKMFYGIKSSISFLNIFFIKWWILEIFNRRVPIMELYTWIQEVRRVKVLSMADISVMMELNNDSINKGTFKKDTLEKYFRVPPQRRKWKFLLRTILAYMVTLTILMIFKFPIWKFILVTAFIIIFVYRPIMRIKMNYLTLTNLPRPNDR